MVKVVVQPEDTVTQVKDKVLAAESIPFRELEVMLNGEGLDDRQTMSDCGIKEESSLDLVVRATEADFVSQLSELLRGRDLSCDELGLLYCYKFGASVSQALMMIGYDGTSIADFIKLQKAFALENGRVSIQRPEATSKEEPATISVDIRRCQELHEKISSRTFHAEMCHVVDTVVDTITDISFLNIDYVVKGGSVYKGTAIAGSADMEIVCFVRGLPETKHGKWLPPLLTTVANVLGDSCSKLAAPADGTDVGLLTGTQVTRDSVKLSIKGYGAIDVRFSPILESYTAVLQKMKEECAGPNSFYMASLVKEKTQFVARQLGSVKVTIRLLKWWRDQQEWSSNLVRPSDEVLELMVIYSAAQTKPADQREAISNVFSLMTRFKELKVVWSNFYSKEDIWPPLFSQCPLIMDPVSPYRNVAEHFDATEMINIARATTSFDTSTDLAI
jgi:hypothetical protein